ncbi:MAG: acyltransferase [Eubacteriaceae bacterium]|jgi:acetyltransferase-like isoleucine patch superfamily enzyme
MLAKLKQIIRNQLYGYHADSDSYIRYLRENGARIGERVCLFDPQNTHIDVTRPWMLSIGDDVQITTGVTILTHGYDWSVIKGVYGPVLGSCGNVSIGNNCFIGMHATILKGTQIGDNCIIGANSLVNHNIASGWVAAGNPARPIMTVEEYYKKRQNAQLREAEDLYHCYKRQMHQEPPADVFDEFFWLFQKRGQKRTEGAEAKMHLLANYETSEKLFQKTEPVFDGYDAFLEYLRSKSQTTNQ